MDKLTLFCKAIESFEGGMKKGTIQDICSNPGNLRYSVFQEGKKCFKSGCFAWFSSYANGFKALEYDIKLKCLGKSSSGLKPTSTIQEFFNIYAPSSDGNYPKNYALFVASKCGLKITSLLSDIYKENKPIVKDIVPKISNNVASSSMVVNHIETIPQDSMQNLRNSIKRMVETLLALINKLKK